MNIFAWLRRRAPAETDPAPPVVPSLHAVQTWGTGLFPLDSRLPDPDETIPDPEMTGTVLNASDLPERTDRRARQHGPREPLEPVFTMIRYIDATGQTTERRITLRSFEYRGPASIIHAFCHERNAGRCFRVDRIAYFFDPADGEATEPGDYIRDFLGIDIDALPDEPPNPAAAAPARTPSARTAVSAYTAMRRALSPALVILVTAARADDHLHPEEMEAIQVYSEHEAMILHRAGTLADPPRIEDFDKLARTVARMRPTVSDLDAALHEISGAAPDARARIARFLTRVVQADGIVLPVESTVLQQFEAWAGQ